MTLTREDILGMLREAEALREGHFELSSGLHSRQYLQCAVVLQHPSYAGQLGAALAAGWRAAGPTVVVGPALGGIVIAHEVGRALNVRALFMERVAGAMTLRRGLTVGPEDRVLIVEDVLTTGGSVREVLDAVVAAGARAIGIGTIVDRTLTPPPFPVPYQCLIRLELEAVERGACALCRQGVPLDRPGSRPQPPGRPAAGVAGGGA